MAHSSAVQASVIRENDCKGNGLEVSSASMGHWLEQLQLVLGSTGVGNPYRENGLCRENGLRLSSAQRHVDPNNCHVCRGNSLKVADRNS